MTQPIITLAEARRLGLKYYFTGNPCPSGHITKRSVTGRGCAECIKLAGKRQRDEHPEITKSYNDRRDPEKLRQDAKAYYWAHRDEILPIARERMAKNYRENPAANIATVVNYRANNLDKVNARLRTYYLNRRAADPEWRIIANLRTRISNALRGNIKVGSTIRDVGCTPAFLIQWLEQKFVPGMSWDNYGTYWNVDHIKPLTGFDLSDLDQFRAAVHYTNLQPLTVGDNTRKGGVKKKLP